MSPSLRSRFSKRTPSSSGPTPKADDKSRRLFSKIFPRKHAGSSSPPDVAPGPSSTSHAAPAITLSPLRVPVPSRVARISRAISRRAASIATSIAQAFAEDEDDHEVYERLTERFMNQYLTKSEVSVFLARVASPAGSSGRNAYDLSRALGGASSPSLALSVASSEVDRPLSPLLPPSILRRPIVPPRRVVEEGEAWWNVRPAHRSRGAEAPVTPARAPVRAPVSPPSTPSPETPYLHNSWSQEKARGQSARGKRVVRFALSPPRFVLPVPARDGEVAVGEGRRGEIGGEVGVRMRAAAGEQAGAAAGPAPVRGVGGTGGERERPVGEMIGRMEELGMSFFEEEGEAVGVERMVARLEGMRVFFGEDEQRFW
ncbi:hypothetical protein MMC30_005239 [Trapelia coarctata]|nr:hypothetical protein [Trapelia coarctata]